MSSDEVTGPQTCLPPEEVRIHQRSRRLELRWAGGDGISLCHARLRQACRCAWCESRRRRPEAGEVIVAADIALEKVTAVGDVGLQLHFSDGHDRGIYPWSYLRSLAL